MLRLHLSNSSSTLINTLLEHVGKSDIFSPTTLIVPGTHLKSYIQRSIAHRHEIVMGWKFQGFESYLSDKLKQSGCGEWLKGDQIQMAICDVLADRRQLAHPSMKSVRVWLLAGSGAPNDVDLRRFQLSKSLMSLYSNYELLHEDMLSLWSKGQLFSTHIRQRELELWQSFIWRHLFALEGVFDKLKKITLSSFAQIEFLNQLDFRDPLHIVGFDKVCGIHKKILSELSQLTEVNMYSLSVNQRQLEDISEKNCSKLYGLWGSHTESIFNHLKEISDELSFDFVDVSPGKTVLDFLKNNLFCGQADSKVDQPPDNSLQIFACSSIQREAQIVSNQIWKIVSEDKINFNEIAVVLGQKQLSDYRLHLESEFRSNHHIPYQIDLPSQKTPVLLQAFELMLALPGSDFARGDLLKLLRHPNFSMYREAGDRKAWLEFCDIFAVFRGENSEANKGYIKKDVRNWEQALRRMSLSMYFDDSAAFYNSGAEKYMAKHLDSEQISSSARFTTLVRALMMDSHYLSQHKASLKEWSILLRKWFQQYLIAFRPEDENVYFKINECISRLSDCDVSSRKLDFDLVKLLLIQNLSFIQESNVTATSRGVTVSTYLPLRHIPFKIVFLVGLGDGLFPISQPTSVLDVSGQSPVMDNLGASAQELSCFMERIYSTKEKLRLSYVSQDRETMETLAPSFVIQDLMEVLPQYSILHPPLNREDPNEQFPEYNPSALSDIQAVKLRSFFPNNTIDIKTLVDLRPDWGQWSGLYDHRDIKFNSDVDRLVLPLKSLSDFLLCPLQAWVRHVLGVSELHDKDPFEEDEPLSAEFVDKTVFLRDVFKQAKGEDSKKLLSQQEETLEMTGRVSTGLFLQGEYQAWSKVLDKWDDHLEEAAIETPYSTLSFGKTEEYQESDTIVPSLEFDIVVAEKMLSVSLEGSTCLLSKNLDTVIVPVLSKGSADKSKYFVRGFTEMMALTVAGLRPEAGFKVSVIDRQSLKKTSQLHFSQVSVEDAREWLVMLLTQLLNDSHEYLLPIEAVNQHVSKELPLEATIQKCINNTFSKCSSHYGPVKDLDKFLIPDDVEFEKRLKKRYQLYFELQS